MTNAAETTMSEPSGPVGIGGWLILPIIGFIGTIALTTWSLIQAVMEIEGLIAIMSADSGPLTTLKAPLIASTVGGIAVIASAAYCLWLIAGRKRAIKSWATAHYLLFIAAALSDLWADWALRQAVPDAPSDPTIVRGVARGFLTALIWIPYFHLSKRVRNTFTNPPEHMPAVGDASPTAAERTI